MISQEEPKQAGPKRSAETQEPSGEEERPSKKQRSVTFIDNIMDLEIRRIFSSLNKIADDDDASRKELQKMAGELIKRERTRLIKKAEGSISDGPAPAAVAATIAENDNADDQAAEESFTWADLCSYAMRLEQDGRMRKNKEIREFCITLVELVSTEIEQDNNRTGKKKRRKKKRIKKATAKLAEYFRDIDDDDDMDTDVGAYAEEEEEEEEESLKQLFKTASTSGRGTVYLQYSMTATDSNQTKRFPFSENPSLDAFQAEIAHMFYPDSESAIVHLLKQVTNEDGKRGEDYIPQFVETDPKNFSFLESIVGGVDGSNAPRPVATKSQALLVAGVSGSGKTWLTRFGLPRQSTPETGFLFATLDDNVDNRMKKSAGDAEIPSWVSRAISYLFSEVENAELRDDSLYNRISESSMAINQRRNEVAMKAFYDICLNVINRNERLHKWWHGSGPTLKHLVVVIDECGKSLPFTRGIIDSCRVLVGDGGLCTQGQDVLIARTKTAKIVLAGTRLDSWSKDMASRAHGTDPSKYELVLMVKPDLKKLDGAKISGGDLGGWYSKILSENTRILMRGVIPTLCIPALTDHYYDREDKDWKTLRTEDRVAAGTDNALMKYGARLYYFLNAIKGLDHKQRNKLFSSLFSMFLSRSLDRRVQDEKGRDLFSNQGSLLEDFRVKIPEDMMTEIFAKGLALEDPSSVPNKAMAYLACHGEQLPLMYGEGIMLEDALEYHLAKHYHARGSPAMVYTLGAAWAPAWGADEKEDSDSDNKEAAPPAAKKKDNEKEEAAAVLAAGPAGREKSPGKSGSGRKNNLSANTSGKGKASVKGGTHAFKYAKTPDKKHGEDVNKLVEMIKEAMDSQKNSSSQKKPIHIILRQGVNNAEGPDVMVLTIKVANEEATAGEEEKPMQVESEAGASSSTTSTVSGAVALPTVQRDLTSWRLVLDLYQCKNYQNFAMEDNWFHTVGVKQQDDPNRMVLCKDENEKAGYCNVFVDYLVQEVGKKLEIEIASGSVGGRVVVVPQQVEEVLKACHHARLGSLTKRGMLLQAVEQSSSDLKVCLWTAECLHPTISVVKVKPGEECPTETSDGAMNQS